MSVTTRVEQAPGPGGIIAPNSVRCLLRLLPIHNIAPTAAKTKMMQDDVADIVTLKARVA